MRPTCTMNWTPPGKLLNQIQNTKKKRLKKITETVPGKQYSQNGSIQ